MQQSVLNLIADTVVQTALRQAWQDSQPDRRSCHEEGGFIVRNAAGELAVIRWPKGVQDAIILPDYAGGRVGTDQIIATFHTHPNTGENYLQEPSETDKRAVRDDTEFKSTQYEGEFVISQQIIYHIAPSGEVSEVGATQTLLAL